MYRTKTGKEFDVSTCPTEPPSVESSEVQLKILNRTPLCYAARDLAAIAVSQDFQARVSSLSGIVNKTAAYNLAIGFETAFKELKKELSKLSAPITNYERCGINAQAEFKMKEAVVTYCKKVDCSS